MPVRSRRALPPSRLPLPRRRIDAPPPHVVDGSPACASLADARVHGRSCAAVAVFACVARRPLSVISERSSDSEISIQPEAVDGRRMISAYTPLRMANPPMAGTNHKPHDLPCLCMPACRWPGTRSLAKRLRDQIDYASRQGSRTMPERRATRP
jgi:hypothetical protein